MLQAISRRKRHTLDSPSGCTRARNPALAPAPAFDRPPSDPLNASSLSLLALNGDGDLSGAAAATGRSGAHCSR